MKVLLINGSPKEKGCTYTALCEVAKTLNEENIETEIFHIGNKPIQGCIGCGNCAKTQSGRCVFNDDTVNVALKKAQEADGFIFGSPVHYAAASGAITSFLDRAFYAGKKYFEYKPGAAIVSCRRAGSTVRESVRIYRKWFRRYHTCHLPMPDGRIFSHRFFMKSSVTSNWT